MPSLKLKEAAFIDYGCGAGRVMIIAAESGFKNITGIELSPYLVALCQKNVKSYSVSRRDCELTVINHNAAEYIPMKADVFFFYVPFGLDIYRQVITNIKKSTEVNPRKVYVLDLLSEQKSVDFTQEGFQLITKQGNLKIFTYSPD